MSPKQEVFVNEYLVDRNGKAAAIRAGYSAVSAASTAKDLKQLPAVRDAIAASTAAQSQRLQATADDVILEMVRMALFDPIVFKDVRTLKDFENLSEDARRAIVGWSWDRKGNLVLKLGKVNAIEMLGRYHGLFNDSIEVKGIIGLAGRMRKMGDQ